MDNNNGKGIFYGVIGVATLIVAIIGATFAYFTATNSNSNTIQGEAAQAGLQLSVVLKSTDATGPLVPQLDTTIDTAVTGTGEKLCIDGNGNTVCKVYTVTITNTGSSAAEINGTLELTAASMANLMWAVKADSENKLGYVTGTDSGTFSNGVFGKDITDLITPKDGNENVGSFVLGAAKSGTETKSFDLVVFIKETKSSQNTTDKDGFTGTVTFNSAGGSGVTSTFTA